MRLGKLSLPEPPERYIPSRLIMNRFESLPIEMTHALQVIDLPNLHQDPFDRILIAQSQVEEMPIISIDNKIQQYPVDIIW